MNKSRINSPVVSSALVEWLIAAQFPRWANLPIVPVVPGGWDNRSFRLGEEMCVRLPSAERYSAQVAKEQYWLPRLAPQLPLAIPHPLALGAPGEGYPWSWSVYGWLAGEAAQLNRISDVSEFAADLAGFLYALQAVDLADGPPPGQHNFQRGGSLCFYDEEARRAISTLEGSIDAGAVLNTWEAALATQWQRPPVWLHGDVSAGNLLVQDGRLSAVIDFGNLGIGDPACDLAIAWTLLPADGRQVFRRALNLDEATWARGRGWALWKALITLAECAEGERDKSAEALRVIGELTA